jgi:hypothetical protein
MLTTILPVISFAVSLAQPAAGSGADVVQSARSAQVRLSETLSEADAIHSVTARGRQIAFSIDRDGTAMRAIATTRRNGDVVALTITPAGPALGDAGNLSWLSSELAESTAVMRLSVDEDGAVTISTHDGRAYMVIPGRGSGGNVAAESRWAAAWNDHDS